MANNEVDKIRDLKMRKDEEEKKVENRKEEEVKKKARVTELEGEIKALIDYNKQHHELPEEVELKKLRDRYDLLMIKREEQQETIDVHRTTHQQLKE